MLYFESCVRSCTEMLNCNWGWLESTQVSFVIKVDLFLFRWEFKVTYSREVEFKCV